MRGRPTDLTPEVQATVIAAIRRGNYRDTAAKLAGITRQTIWNWEKRGEAGEAPYAEFFDALQKAESESEDSLLAEIRNAQPAEKGGQGADLWQAKAWIMERRWPKRWAQRVRQAVTEELDAFTDRLQRKLDEATYRRVLDASREDAPGEGAPGARH